MLKAIKYLFIAIIILIIIIAIALIILVNVINPNKFKPLISKQFYHATGRELTLNGDLRWSLSPLGIKVNDAVLSNAKGFGNTPFASLQYVSIGTKLFPLFLGKIEASKIVINGLTVNLMKNKAGQNNWTMHSPSTNHTYSTTKTTTSTHSLTNKFWDISIPSINAKNVSLIWDNAQTNQHLEIHNLNLKVSNVKTNRMFPVKGSLNITSNKPQLKSQINFKTQAKINPIAGEYALKNFNLKSNWTGKNLPNGKATISIQSDITVKENSLNLNPFTLTLNQDKVNGYLNINNFQPLNINFNVSANQLNLDPYIALFSNNSQQTTTSTTSIAAANRISNNNNELFDKMHQLQMQGNIKITQLTAMKAKMQNVSATIKANNGIINISPVNAQLYQGNYQGSTSIDIRNNTPKLSFHERLQGVQVQSLLKDMYKFNHLTGTANAEIKATTTGLNKQQLFSNANGIFNFSVKNGAIRGINIPYYIKTLSALLKKQSPPKQTDYNTQFVELNGSGTISNGIVSSQNLKLNSPIVLVKGQGKIDLGRQTVNGLLNVTSTKQSSRKIMMANGLPIKVSGTFNQIKFSPEYNKIIAQIGYEKIQTITQNIFNKNGDGIKNIDNRFRNLFR